MTLSYEKKICGFIFLIRLCENNVACSKFFIYFLILCVTNIWLLNKCYFVYFQL